MNKLLVATLLVGFSVSVQQRSPRMELWAFTGPWDPASAASLRANAVRLDVAITGWIGLDSVSAQPILPSPFPDTMRLSKETLRRMAIVTSWHGDRFHPGTIRTLAKDNARLARVASAIASHAASKRYSGLVLDFEALERADLNALVRVVKAIADSARERGVGTIAVAIPATDTAAYPAKPIANVADFVMPMLYDQHWSTSGPGPIASPDWVRASLARRVAEVGASRVIAALPVYGYKWRTSGRAPAEPVSYADAKRLADSSRAPLTRDRASSTLRAKAGDWEIWVTDAELFANLSRVAETAGVKRVALWRIGQEDARIWR